MKIHFLTGLLVGICLVFIFAFKEAWYEPNKATAETFQIEGLYIFTDSKPVTPYVYLGEVDLGFVSGTQYENVRKNLIKRAKQKYPTAEGIILHLNKKGLDKCDVIKF